MASTTRLINFRRLAGISEPLATTLIRLMMACNDLALGDFSMRTWHSEATSSLKFRANGARMYYMRVLIAHLFEAFEIVRHIQNTELLVQAVERCDHRTRASFQRTVDILDTDDYRRMAQIRNVLTFHYDRKSVTRALERGARQFPDFNLGISLGNETIDWHFEPADRIVDGIVVRQIFRVPEDADIRDEVDKITERLRVIGQRFCDFAGYFIWHHTRQ